MGKATASSFSATTPHSTSDTGWYSTFISIVFGLFLAVWLQPIAEEHPSFFPSSDLIDNLFPYGRAIITLLVLVCLWWWYAIMLGHIHPAEGFLMYAYDFITLAVFALGFRFWHEIYHFPAAVLFGAFLMYWRLRTAAKIPTIDETCRKALGYVLNVLYFVFFACILMFASVLYMWSVATSDDAGLAVFNALQVAVLVSLAMGIGATIMAARLVESSQAASFSSTLAMALPPNVYRQNQPKAHDWRAEPPNLPAPNVPNELADARVGKIISALADERANQKNNSIFFSQLRTLSLSEAKYFSYITSMYPIVFGFNGALIKSILKINHVQEWKHVQAIAEQIYEEQSHNHLWREMLHAFDIDHNAVYSEFIEYYNRFDEAELHSWTESFCQAIVDKPENVAPGIFPDAEFPEPVIALYHHLMITSSYSNVDYWEHFAGQFAMEAIILNVVSTSVYPAVVQMDSWSSTPQKLEWWKRHTGFDDGHPPSRSAEAKHVQLGRIALDRSEQANLNKKLVVARADMTMRLFLATATWHGSNDIAFPYTKYVRGER